MFLAAILADILVGHWITHRLPSASKALAILARSIIGRLDRPSRTLSTLKVRGALVVALTLPATFGLGILLNQLLLLHVAFVGVGIILLLPLIDQRRSLSELKSASHGDVTIENTQNADQYFTARTLIANSALKLSAVVTPYAIAWILGGYSLLLPYILLGKIIDAAEKRRSGYPESPFFTVPHFLRELVSVPPAFLASLLIATAHFFVPGTNLGVFTAFFTGATIGPVSRYFPLNTIATGLNLSVEAEIGEKTGQRKKSDKDVHWIGPDDGRAKVQAKDLSKASLVFLISYILFVLILLMMFSALLIVSTTN